MGDCADMPASTGENSKDLQKGAGKAKLIACAKHHAEISGQFSNRLSSIWCMLEIAVKTNPAISGGWSERE
jgi:hypothetical protein